MINFEFQMMDQRGAYTQACGANAKCKIQNLQSVPVGGPDYDCVRL
jgi:hypothetical protein